MVNNTDVYSNESVLHRGWPYWQCKVYIGEGKKYARYDFAMKRPFSRTGIIVESKFGTSKLTVNQRRAVESIPDITKHGTPLKVKQFKPTLTVDRITSTGLGNGVGGAMSEGIDIMYNRAGN